MPNEDVVKGKSADGLKVISDFVSIEEENQLIEVLESCKSSKFLIEKFENSF